MDAHGGLGDDAQSSFTSDAEVVDIDTVRGLGNNTRLQYSFWSHHTYCDHHILDLAVFIALHTRRSRGDPPAQSGAQKRVQENGPASFRA